jgi:hypothetical protein
MHGRPPALSPAVVTACAAFLFAAPPSDAQAVCTSFESIAFGICADEVLFPTVPVGNFSIGISPATAEFKNGDVMSVGTVAYYHSGGRSWHVAPGTTATIQFETPAELFELFHRNTAGGGPIAIRVINTDGDIILTAGPGSSDFFGQIGITGVPVSPPVDRIEIDNTGMSADVVVDDVVFQVPEPSAGLSGGVALASLLAAAGLSSLGRCARRVTRA